MALNTYPSKRFYKAAAKQAGPNWGDVVAVGAGDEILCKSDGNPALKQAYESYGALGRVMPKDGDLGEQGAIDFAPDFDFQYLPGAAGSLIAALFGEDYVPQPLFVVALGVNDMIDFKEGAGEALEATVDPGSYTATELCAAIKTALDDAEGSALTYTVTFNTAIRKFTIATVSTFSLLWNTGTNKAVDISTMCGYSDAADDEGEITYTAENAAVGVAYVHTLDWANYIDNFFTVISTRPGKVWEIPAAVPMKLALKVGGGRLQGAITLRGNTLKDDSTTNEETEVVALTPESEANFVKAQAGILRMNAQAGDALDSDDSLPVGSDLAPEFERTMDAQMVLGGSFISQPAESDFKIGLKVGLPRAGAADVAFLSTFKAMTPQKMDVIFTGPPIAGTHTYKLTIGYPRLKFMGPPDVKLEDIIKNGLEFTAEEAATAPSGMGAHVRPYIELINTRSTPYVS